ncbi:MAG: hypothetical protein J7M27_10435 [Candidatus Latescibacteria bacterium]|nr:hypothetical protein [Candidatus Latescibacterota bacterium]
MANEQRHGSVLPVVLVLSLLLIGAGSRAEAITEPLVPSTCLRSGGVDSGGGVSRSTYVLHSFIGQSTPAGWSQSPTMQLRGGMGYTPGSIKEEESPEPPSNLQAFDTPDDQGHSITLTWTKSPDDGAGLNIVSYYRIYRSRSSELTDPISISSFPWSACPDTIEFSPGSCPALDSLMAMEVGHTILIDSVAAGITEYVDAFVPVNGVSYYYWLDAVAANGGMSAKVVAQIILTAVNEETGPSIPQEYFLYQNFPNPFNPSTEIRYRLAETGEVRLAIYDLLGQVVRELVAERQPAGWYRVSWEGKDEAGRLVSSGGYLYTLEVEGEFLETRKMMLLR